MDKNLKISLLAGAIATAIDQAVHISLHWSHQIVNILQETDTMYYIIMKFVIVAWATWWFLNHTRKDIALKTSITAGLIWGALLSYLYPTMYTIPWHIFHAIAMYIGVYGAMKIIK